MISLSLNRSSVATMAASTLASKPRVNLGGSCELDVLAEPVREDVHIGEVPCGSPSNMARNV